MQRVHPGRGLAVITESLNAPSPRFVAVSTGHVGPCTSSGFLPREALGPASDAPRHGLAAPGTWPWGPRLKYCHFADRHPGPSLPSLFWGNCCDSSSANPKSGDKGSEKQGLIWFLPLRAHTGKRLAITQAFRNRVERREG